MADSNLNVRVEEIVWKIKTLDSHELDELRSRLDGEFALPDEPHELSTRKAVRKRCPLTRSQPRPTSDSLPAGRADAPPWT